LPVFRVSRFDASLSEHFAPERGFAATKSGLLRESKLQ